MRNVKANTELCLLNLFFTTLVCYYPKGRLSDVIVEHALASLLMNGFIRNGALDKFAMVHYLP